MTHDAESLVYSIPSFAAHQDFVRSHQLLRPSKAQTDSVPMETQDLDEADPSV